MPRRRSSTWALGPGQRLIPAGHTTESYDLGGTENRAVALVGTPAGIVHSRSRRSSRISLIRSKFLPPAAPPGAVRRPRLLEKLASGRGRALTLLCAPPATARPR